MRASFPPQQLLRAWLTGHNTILLLGSIAGNLKSFGLLRPQSRRLRIVNDFAATTPHDSRHFVAEFQAALTQFLHETAQNACHGAGAAHHL
jgi:hypothetical protein